jgi:hypothetical protein
LKKQRGGPERDGIFLNTTETFSLSDQRQLLSFKRRFQVDLLPRPFSARRTYVSGCTSCFLILSETRSNLWPQTCPLYERTYIHGLVGPPQCLRIFSRWRALDIFGHPCLR